MPKEIERKFRVTGDGWRGQAEGVAYTQGYIPATGCTVRVRRAGKTGYLTVKGPRSGISRDEFEYEIPLADAEQLLETACQQPLIEKTRHTFTCAGKTWEVDEFHGANEGLVMAEVELEREDEPVELPEWVGQDVSTEARFTNYALSITPWSDEERA